MRLHAFIRIEDGYMTTACGERVSNREITGVDGFDTALRDVLTEVTCKKCVRKFAQSLPLVHPWDNNSLWRELIDKELRGNVLADGDVASTKKYLLEQVDEVLRLLESAKREVESNRRSIDRVDGTELMTALDYACSVAAVVGFIATNLHLGSLMRHATALDLAIAAVAAGREEA